MTLTPSTSAPVAHNAVPPPSAPSAGRSPRIASHSHIKGLGLTHEGYAAIDGAGFIGQINAREVRLHLLTTKHHGGRIAGISDRSIHALLSDLSAVKGNNITFVIDCSFSPLSQATLRGRSHTRWTPTFKATAADLYHGLWPSARAQPHSKALGFYHLQPTTHVFLAACGPGENAMEGKSGGHFTHAFLEATAELPLHNTSYSRLVETLASTMAGLQHPVCRGSQQDRPIFDGNASIKDSRYLRAIPAGDRRLRVEIGEIQGIAAGSRLSLHFHNYCGSRNLVIGQAIVSDVHPTWCHAYIQDPQPKALSSCWAQVIHWNNSHNFRIHLDTAWSCLLRKWKLGCYLRRAATQSLKQPPLNITRVQKAEEADISITLDRHGMTVEGHTNYLLANQPQKVRVEGRSDPEILRDAARFHLHLERNNILRPLQGLVTIELYRLDGSTWSKSSENMVDSGTAQISGQPGDNYSVLLRNHSDIDLWPYLLHMELTTYGITLLNQPDESQGAPLPRRSSLEIGSGKLGLDAFSFSLPHDEACGFGFLKLYVSSVPLSMGVVEQGPTGRRSRFQETTPMSDNPPSNKVVDAVWDTLIVGVNISPT